MLKSIKELQLYHNNNNETNKVKLVENLFSEEEEKNIYLVMKVTSLFSNIIIFRISTISD